MGIPGNEKADAAAKSALSLPVTRMKLSATDVYLRITKLIFDEWQEVWNCCAGNKLGYYKQKTCLFHQYIQSNNTAQHYTNSILSIRKQQGHMLILTVYIYNFSPFFIT